MVAWGAFGLACAGSSGGAPPASTAGKAAPKEIDVLVAEVLRQSLVESKSMPDRQLLPATGPIMVRSEVLTPGHGVLLGPAALPESKTVAFQLRSQLELQTLADRRGGPVYFVAVTNVTMSGDTATVWMGVELTTPTTEGSGVKLCCCRQATTYRRFEGAWHLVVRSPAVCL